jgi:hypothetical protein
LYKTISERAAEFDRKLQALRAANGEFLAKSVCDYVQLPVHHLLLKSSRDRFRPVNPQDPKSISIMLRDRTKELLAFLRDGKAKGAYLHGPQGVGKSHALYYTVCVLRSDPRSRVIYIPDCKRWTSGNSFAFFLEAVVDAFHSDPEVIDALPSLYEINDSRQRQSDFEDFVSKALPEFCASRGLQLFAMFDQHNGLTPDQRKQLPFSLPENLPEEWTRSALCVVSASANNEYYLKIANDGRWPQLIFNRGFTDAEVASWCAANGLPSPADEPAMNDVLLWTSSIPQDLSLWREQFETLRKGLPPRTKGTAPAWAEAIRRSVELHKSTRKVTLNAQNQKFCLERLVGKEEKDLARSSYIAMALGLPLPSSYLLNQQLMFVEENRIWATTLLATEVLSAYWEPQSTTVEAFEATAKSVFMSKEHGNATKGSVLEMYMLHKLRSQSVAQVGFQLPRCQTTGNGRGAKKVTLKYEIDPYAVRVFRGDSVPPDVDWKQPTLFIPYNSNYPCFDLLLWNGDSLLAVQITVAIAKHVDITQKLHDEWRDALPAGHQKVQFLWIVPGGSVPTAAQQIQTPCQKFLCTLPELDPMGIFPLVQHFTLK